MRRVGRAVAAPTSSLFRTLAARVRPLVVLLVVVGAAGARASVLDAVGPLWRHTSVALPVLWVMFLLAELSYVQVIFRREGYAFSLMEVPLVLGLWFATGPTLLVAHLSGTAVAFFFQRGHRGVKLWFNVAKVLVESTVAVAVFRAVGPGDTPLALRGMAATLAATGAAVAVAVASIAAAIALHQGGTDIRKLLVTSIGNIVATGTNTCVGLVAAVLVAGAPLSALLLLPPAALLVLSYASLIHSRRRQEGLEFLYRASCILHRGASHEGPVTELLELSRATFGAGTAELTLYSPEDPSRGLCTSVGPGDEVRRLEPVLLAAHERSSSRSTAPGAVMTADLQGERRLLGRLVVAEPGAARRAFSPREVQLFSTLVNQVSTALENGVLEASLAQVTELKEELHHRAFHDDLTGLANRAMFVDALGRRWSRRRRKSRLPPCSSTWTTSSGSTTPSGTLPATRCWSRWRTACGSACGPVTSRPA